ncbi:MAG: VapC toxin protein [uncultured Chloroflexia bacterium]|uniref:Ribonuclease VapC n=1 Tax=uncultured Chloroflexia bacterium TaxID=1672391 RepID=A0A6J4JI69_9CHLR|nr:MAG: VapC toxin protein [uncultured Chloroflexia bacterium]
MTFLLDTDTCVFWLRGRASIREHVAVVGPQAISVSIITVAELRYGAACSNQPAANEQAINAFTSGIHVLGVDDGIVAAFAMIKAGLRQQGMLIEDFDLLIAATAHTHGLTLVTNNVAHFGRVPGLLLENWLE